jgi:hypothetical protein
MERLAYFRKWKLAIIDSDEKKVDKLRSIIESPVYHFASVPPFLHYLETITDTPACVILVISDERMKELPTNTKEKLHRLYIYGDNNESKFQLFNDVCLYLANLIIAQNVEQSITYRRSKQHGPARLLAQETMARTKTLIDQLQDLCDGIDENILFGEQALN